ncbi:MAG: cytochrome c [Saprospiraceae bacterium]|jgi:mono/diheme cytochrome c family protein|nr:cytochrome c [Saprospiraceae bacterium]MBP9209405.1 cytochrome c [Saprospiraceae bacterium]MBV6471847.1 hypothetical protein [Saprospiraceae bacterium]
MRRTLVHVVAIAAILSFMQCRPAEGNYPGTEYMPDMGHSIAYEANVNSYYFYNTWESAAERARMSAPRLPVEGTRARGSVGWSNGRLKGEVFNGSLSNNAVATPVNGSVPYYYGNTEEERARASREIVSNPIPWSQEGLQQGQVLYDIYCGICHGAKGDGNGYIVRDDGGKYPAQPANFLKSDFIASTEGRYYHAIMYGRNVMGPHSDKLSFEERWNVIHYIRSLQATSLGQTYGGKPVAAQSVPGTTPLK